MEFTTLVLRFRLKDKHAKWLSEQAREVDFVWNYCAEFFLKVREREKRFLSAYDFNPYTKGAGKAGLHLHSRTTQEIGDEYPTRRMQASKAR
ncbi:hypothetical protein PPGU19_070550 (plasmid) [Paraburkholderia sp. PGU19]|uniref:hypothetical protein n=1 Tax=Paraburkholderia sp. PGU19 TaxID=2735434 RepID=UPI0015DB1594|nr:hypothetical protein [Paraburkholderia sp. PGU19]BCG02487.1 hypothetical protein PPGU19_070550 [Paraburkholderia sp. PGU19]